MILGGFFVVVQNRLLFLFFFCFGYKVSVFVFWLVGCCCAYVMNGNGNKKKCRWNTSDVEKKEETKEYDIHICLCTFKCTISLTSSKIIWSFLLLHDFQKCNSTKCFSFSDDWFCSIIIFFWLCFAISIELKDNLQFQKRSNEKLH